MTIQEKIEAKTEQMKEKNKNKKPATRKQKVIASILIPVAGVLVAAAIASPNNNHRETTPPPPADTSHHASAEKKSNVKFNGESPDVEKAIDKARDIATNEKLSRREQIDQVKALAKDCDVSTEILNQYTNGLVLNVREGIILEHRAGVSDLMWLFKGALVAEKNNHAGFNGEFADEFVQLQEDMYMNWDAKDSAEAEGRLNKLQENVNNVEY
jgi:hypothetical protein